MVKGGDEMTNNRGLLGKVLVVIAMILLGGCAGWEPAGGSPVSSGQGPPGFVADEYEISLWKQTGRPGPYLAYPDFTDGGRVVVRKYFANEDVWQTTANLGVRALRHDLGPWEGGGGWQPAIAVADLDDEGKVSVYAEYSSAEEWRRIGQKGFTPRNSRGVDLLFYRHGTLGAMLITSARLFSDDTPVLYTQRGYLNGTWHQISTPQLFTAERMVYLASTVVGYSIAVALRSPVGGRLAIALRRGVGDDVIFWHVDRFISSGLIKTQVALNGRYVAYVDKSVGYKTVVRRMEGMGANATWDLLGQEGFSEGAAGCIDIVGANIPTQPGMGFMGLRPFVVFSDYTRGGRATVMQYTESAGWTLVGNQGFSDGEARGNRIVVDEAQRMIYVAYFDASHNNAVIVQRHEIE